MFTGIIEQTAKVVDYHQHDDYLRLTIENPFHEEQINLGDSISINGGCLTVTVVDSKHFCFDVSPETLSCTTFKTLSANEVVNLEKAVSLQKPLGGHLVLGHVDDVANLDSLTQHDDFVEMIFSGFKQPQWLIEKGSIAINGISLTINAILDKQISCMIIPHTLAHTTLGSLKVNDKVNIEYDYVAKIVTRQSTLKSLPLPEENVNVY